MSDEYRTIHDFKIWLARKHRLLAGKEPGRGATTIYTQMLDKLNEFERDREHVSDTDPLD